MAIRVNGGITHRAIWKKLNLNLVEGVSAAPVDNRDSVSSPPEAVCYPPGASLCAGGSALGE